MNFLAFPFFMLLLGLSKIDTLSADLQYKIYSSEPNETNYQAYPNPQTDAYSSCKIQKRGLLCDPEGLLNDSERENLFEMIENFPNNTQNPLARTECMRKGVSLGIALSRHFYNAVPGSGDEIAKEMSHRWFEQALKESNCSKFVMVVLSYASETIIEIGIHSSNVSSIFEHQKAFLLEMEFAALKTGKFYEAMVELVHGILLVIRQANMDPEQHASELQHLKQEQHLQKEDIGLLLVKLDELQDQQDFVEQRLSAAIVPLWLCIAIAVCCSILMPTIMAISYRVFVKFRPGNGQKNFYEPISMRNLERRDEENVMATTTNLVKL